MNAIWISKQPSPRVALPARVRRVRCSCGTCPRCLDDAKWDRIFNEKFADPTYYDRASLVRFESPLNRLS